MTERLRELLAAGGITPGPWFAGTQIMAIRVSPPPTGPSWGSYIRRGNRRITDYIPSRTDPVQADRPAIGADAAYIAACDPDTIRELLDAHDRMAGALRTVAEWLDEFYGPIEEYDHDDGLDDRGMVQLDHGHDEYMARIEVAMTVRAALEEEKP